MKDQNKHSLFGWKAVPNYPPRAQKFIDLDNADNAQKRSGQQLNYQSQLVAKMKEAATRRQRLADSLPQEDPAV